MKKYPVYYQGRQIGAWNPLMEDLWEDILKAHVREDDHRTHFIPHFDGDKVIITKRLAGEGG